MKSRDVRIWDIRLNRLSGKKKSYTVRWTVSGRERSRNFATRALADNFRSDLMQAVGHGEAFNADSGLPDSMTEPVTGVTWFAFVQRYVEMKWPTAAAKSRDSMTDALASVTPHLVRDLPGRPASSTLRTALREFGLAPSFRQSEPSPFAAAALRWLADASIGLDDLTETTVVRSALDALASKLNGQPAAATTMRRKRAVFYNALQYAVELDLLDYNPVDKLRVRSHRKKVVDVVDRRVVVNPRQLRELLTALSYVGNRGRGPRLVAFFACLYFAALRPGEALDLRERNCHLPTTGWGRLTLERSRPQAGKRWTDSGQVHDERGLKHRGEDEPRSVPIPPELVTILRGHIARHGVGPDGRLFRSEHGNVVAASTYSRAWRDARLFGLQPHQVDSPMAARPYDLRHTGVSLWLNAGVPATEVAERAGHSVDVLLRVYAKCIDGQEAAVNRRIEDALGGLS